MLIKQENYQNIDVVVAASGRQETVKCAQTLAAAGAEIIITRKGTRRIVEEVTNLKVVSLNNSLSDYLWMLKERGLHTPGLIAFFSYDPMSSDILQMCEMLEVQTKNYIFKSFADCRGCVERALKDGAVFSVGGAWTDPWAKRLGLPHVIVENSVGTILNALESATQLRRVQVEEAEKQCLFKTQSEMYQAVLDFTHDAILAIDENGRIQVLNPPAERIMGCRAADSVGQPVEAVLPNTLLPDVLESGEKQLDQIMQIHQTLCNTNRIPILVDGQRRGVVATFQDVKQLQNSEQKIRLKLHEKGLVAKYAFNDILGDSPAIRSTIQIARSYAASRASVLILGETGTGKELFAQSIHNASDRRDGPFVAINCAAVSNSLLESELFGYEAGSFTGASRGGREGVFELAHGGTLFLDEIGEIPRETQVELLRVLQEKEIRRVGGSRVIPVDVRIIAATNKDLLQETVEGRFREDLYYRLDVLDLKLPPLRERGDDVKILGLHLFRQLPGGKDPIMQSQFLYLLEQAGPYQWYGNIRELQNFVERANILMRNAGASSVTVSDILRRRAEPAPEPCQETESRDRRAIEAALHNHPGSMADAARSLGCSRQTLWRKMKKYGIQR
ncbi:sigma 54-interacting transcriptional regulator [Oscillibacter acetigenes]|uniref:sigma 54-interacting transcriptional regulator n=1 Tax=Oscillibacter acetigenes TaxID=2981792 RepID=UPI002265E309|nr:sigma 54-interacting transcriptional regulator [Oscillibacter acetigenes]MCU6749459.1 sigma 54-interacting transcriptional regulator [Oscillibacter acetigenes]